MELSIDEFRAISEDSKKVGELENANRLLAEENQRLREAVDAKTEALEAEREENRKCYERIAELERTANSVNVNFLVLGDSFLMSYTKLDRNLHYMDVESQAKISNVVLHSLPSNIPQEMREKVLAVTDMKVIEPESKISQTFEAGSKPTITNL